MQTGSGRHAGGRLHALAGEFVSAVVALTHQPVGVGGRAGEAGGGRGGAGGIGGSDECLGTARGTETARS